MADLPEDRSVDYSPPFMYCAVDHFGPFYIKQGRKQVKRYGVLFTCIHIDVNSSMETDVFINALRRFMLPRINPSFKIAERELRAELEKMDEDRIHNEFRFQDVKWIKPPPPPLLFLRGCVGETDSNIAVNLYSHVNTLPWNLRRRWTTDVNDQGRKHR